VVPKLERWASETRKVIIVGDAAHAIPPSAGQGINQAFEDVYMLALLLGRKGVDMAEALSFWQNYRQERVNRIVELNKLIDQRRMPADDAVMGQGAEVRQEAFDLGWLYRPDFKSDVEEWLSKR